MWVDKFQQFYFHGYSFFTEAFSIGANLDNIFEPCPSMLFLVCNAVKQANHTGFRVVFLAGKARFFVVPNIQYYRAV